MTPHEHSYFQPSTRWNRWEIAFWLAWAAAYFIPGTNLPLLTHILVWGLFAMSLDLILGYRGIASLGHAAFFGIGAYAAGFLAKFGWTEPLSGLLLAGITAGLTGLLTGRIVRGLHGVALLMVTLGLNMMLYDAAQRATDITGGDDGLQGVALAPVLGLFRFDMYGHTAYWYVLTVAFVLLVLARALVRSPFGLALRGARENPLRMLTLGAPIERDAILAFGLSAAGAGIAGALLTQTTQFVAPEVLAFQRSADVLTMLVIGGLGRLYGGFIGALVFVLLHDTVAALDPIYWYFWIGLLLVFIVTFFRQGILNTLDKLLASRRGEAV